MKLIVILASFPTRLMSHIQSLSQGLKIPVFPFEKKVSTRKIQIDRRCKSFSNYSKCVERLYRCL